MKWNCEETATRLRRVRVFAGVMLTMMMIVPMGRAQTTGRGAEGRRGKCDAAQSTQTFHLKIRDQMREMNDIQTDLRNMVPQGEDLWRDDAERDFGPGQRRGDGACAGKSLRNSTSRRRCIG